MVDDVSSHAEGIAADEELSSALRSAIDALARAVPVTGVNDAVVKG